MPSAKPLAEHNTESIERTESVVEPTTPTKITTAEAKPIEVENIKQESSESTGPVLAEVTPTADEGVAVDSIVEEIDSVDEGVAEAPAVEKLLWQVFWMEQWSLLKKQ